MSIDKEAAELFNTIKARAAAQPKAEQQEYVEYYGIDVKVPQRVAKAHSVELNEISSFCRDAKNFLDAQTKKKNRCKYSEYVQKWGSLHTRPTQEQSYDVEFMRARRDLSMEYANTFNVQAPIEILDDLTEQVLTVLPPLYTPLCILGREDQTGGIAKFITAYDTDDQTYKMEGHNTLVKDILRNSLSPEQRSELQKKTFIDSIKVLEVLNPEHPLVKAVHLHQEREAAEKAEAGVEQINKSDLTSKDNSVDAATSDGVCLDF